MGLMPNMGKGRYDKLAYATKWAVYFFIIGLIAVLGSIVFHEL